jgi:hypothetical protein
MKLLLEDHQVELIHSRDISHRGLLKKVKSGNNRVPRVWKLLVDNLPYDIFGGEMETRHEPEIKVGDGVKEPHFMIKTKNSERTVFYVINLMDHHKSEEKNLIETFRTARKLNEFYSRFENEFEEDSAGFAVVIAKKRGLF